MSETWLMNNPHLLEYVNIPGYSELRAPSSKDVSYELRINFFFPIKLLTSHIYLKPYNQRLENKYASKAKK
jgi:hypothetical protein